MHPNLASELAREQQRDMLAQARQRRLARQVVALARALQQADRAEQRMRAAARKALRLRSGLWQ